MTTLFQWAGITLFATALGLFGVDITEAANVLASNDSHDATATSTLDLTCPDDLTTVITENACSKTLDLIAPDIPMGFNWVSYKATYTFQGIQIVNGNTDLDPPDPITVDVTPGEMSSVEFWGGDNVVEYVAIDMGGIEMTCSYSIAVLDGFAPFWVDNINEYSYPGECGIDDAIQDIWFGDHLMSPLDNCCNAVSDSPIITDTTHLCGGSIDVTFYVIGYDGSGDDFGNADDTPCTLGVNPASPLFTDTLWITVNLTDNIPPVIEGAPGPDTISCNATPVMPDLTASDACFGDLTDSIDIVILDDSDLDCGNGAINRFITYQATVDDECGNSDTATWTVYFMNMDDLVVDLGDDLLLCTEDMYTIDAGLGGDSYTWSTGASTQEITVDVTGSYYVTVTSGSCCAVDSIFLSFGMDVVLNASGGAITCAQSTVTLMAGVNTDVYEWTGPNGFMSNEQNPEVDEVGTYMVTATSNEGCSGMDTVEVVFDTIAPDVSASFGDVNCIAETIEVNGMSETEGVTYSWAGPGGFLANIADTTVQLAGDYTLTVTAPNGCQASTQINNGNDISSPRIEVRTTKAIDGLNGTAWVDVSGGQLPFSFHWSDGQGTDTAAMLNLGLYSVTVSDDNGCTALSEFYIDPAVTICDVGATGIDVETLVKDTLSAIAPYSVYEEDCVRQVFGNPADGSLYVRTFLFEKRASQNELTLVINSDPETSVQAFVFSCLQFPDYTSQFCEDVISDSGTLDVPPGLYYIAVIGDSLHDYTLIIEEDDPINVCAASTGDVTCGVQIQSQLTGEDVFNKTNGIYGDCLRGDRPYTGPEKVYRFEAKSPSKVRINFTSESDMGVFIYDFQCARTCLSVFETVGQGIAEDVIDMNAGLYFIVIDQATDVAGKGFTFEITCEALDLAPWPDRRQMECYDEDNFHTVKFPADSIQLDKQILGESDEVTVFFLDPTGSTKIGPGVPIFLSDNNSLKAFADIPQMSDTCGYLEGENLSYRIVTGLDVRIDGTATYETADAGLFKIGAVSDVNTMKQKPGTRNSVSRVHPLEVKDVPYDKTITKLAVFANQEWRVRQPSDSWITKVYVEGSSPQTDSGSGDGRIVIEHTANDTTEARTANIQVLFKSLNEVLTYKMTQSPDSTISIVKTIKSVKRLEVYPNPTNDKLWIDITLNKSSDVRFTLYDLVGKPVYQKQNRSMLEDKFQMNLFGVPSGIYFLRVEIDGEHLTRKIIKH